MPVCSFKGCTNSSKKKFKMNSFPRNPQHRAKWIKNMDLKDWKYHQGSVLCEVHFEAHMWEKIRVDGTKKLKCNAVPTIFGNRIVKESEFKNTDSLKSLILNEPLLLDSSSTSIILPFPDANETKSVRVIPINNSRKTLQSTLTSILKSQIKAKSSSVTTIKINKDVLEQLKMANSKTPIIIPASSAILNSKIKSTNTESVGSETSIKQTDIILNQTERNINSVLLDSETLTTHEVDIGLNQAKVNINMELSDSDTTAIQTVHCNLNHTEADTDIDTSDSEVPGIILNQTEAKKLADERFEKMDKLLLKQLKLNDALRKKLVSVKYKLQQQAKEENTDHKKLLSTIFTDDQIRALELRHYNPKSTTTWSYKTMMKAIKLKEECGTRGYEELLRQNFPLPSIRTISRWCTLRNMLIP